MRNPLRRGESRPDPDEQREKKTEAQRELRHASAGAQSAAQTAAQATEQTVKNPDFFETLTDLGFEEFTKYDWLQEELAAKTSPAHFIGNREAQHEKRSMYLNANEAERLIAERSPGRLAAGEDWRLEVAQQTHRFDSKQVTTPMTQAQDRRAVRDAFEAITDFQSNAVGGAGRRSVTEATSVNKVERQREESKSRREELSERVFG
jgi:hypothetical protein